MQKRNPETRRGSLRYATAAAAVLLLLLLPRLPHDTDQPSVKPLLYLLYLADNETRDDIHKM